jgi:N-acetyl-beta-hexosaminidase
MSALQLDSRPEELEKGFAAIAAAFPERFAEGGKRIDFRRVERVGLRITRDGSCSRVEYGRAVDAFRALGLLLADDGVAQRAAVDESPRFDSLGLMLDCSRNGASRPETIRRLLVHAALMGIDSFMLYLEDMYEVPGEKFFGYLRGAYSRAELSALDDFAFDLGIELFPCIQCLGHLEQILQWPAYEAYRDDQSILLADDPKTYALLEKMIAAASAPFRSRRINLGMDEANGLGQGAYRRIFGEKRPFEIMNAHLAKVRDICARLGLEPIIWSDMYFRLGSKTHGYYDDAWTIPAGIAEKIPADVRLVYWDYYHTSYDDYVKLIGRHRSLGVEPAVALGTWTWNRFWAELGFAAKTIAPGMRACRDSGIREVSLTSWGDDGMEVDVYSALPAWQLFAEYGWASEARGGDEASIETLAAERFRGSVGGDYWAWKGGSDLDRLPRAAEKHANPSKVLLYEDPLLGLWERQYRGVDLAAHYAMLAARLDATAARGGADARLGFPAQIARVLSLKAALRPRLADAYRSGDRAALLVSLSVELPALRAEVERLWRMHRSLWLDEYKCFGLEVIEMRYGFLRTRLESMSLRLEDYLAGRLNSIPELESELEPPYPCAPEDTPEVASFRRIASPSKIV